MKNWIDLREPPESLVALALSTDCDTRSCASHDLGNYAHVKTVEILMILLDDEWWRVRSGAIDSLTHILAYEHLASYKQSVGLAISAHLEIEHDRETTIRIISNFIAHPVIL